MREMNDNYNMQDPYNYKSSKKGNGALIAAVSVLASIVVIGAILVALFATGVISFGDNFAPDTQQEIIQGQNPVPVVKQPVPVERTMYIGNCKSSVTLRVGPGTNFDEIRQVGLGEAVYVVEYTTDDFALVTYGANRGYIMRDYIVSVRPDVLDYNEAEVENFVENALRAFVNGINTGDTSYVYQYFSGSEAEQEIKSHNSIYEVVMYEEILSMNCHSVQRISASQVTCTRDSVIRVEYIDGSVKDITEKYKYTIDLSNGRMYIVEIEKV